jgi:Tfp pilus assembly protein PilO
VTRNRLWLAIAVGAAVLVLCGGWFTVVAPARSDAAARESQTLARTQSNARLASKLGELKALSRSLPAKQAAIDTLTARIPTGVELPTLIRSVTALSTSAGIELTAITPGSPTALSGSGSLRQVPLALTVSGSYFGVEAFLLSLEDAQRATQVTGLSLDHGTSANGGVTAQISLRVFVSGPAAPTAAATAPGAGAAPTAPVTASNVPNLTPAAQQTTS